MRFSRPRTSMRARRDSYWARAQTAMQESLGGTAPHQEHIAALHRRVIDTNQWRDEFSADPNRLPQGVSIVVPGLPLHSFDGSCHRPDRGIGLEDVKALAVSRGLDCQVTGSTVMLSGKVAGSLCLASVLIEEHLDCTGLEVEDHLCFRGAHFRGEVRIRRKSSIGGDVIFDDAELRDDLIVNDASVRGSIALNGAEMNSAIFLGEARVGEHLFLGKARGAPGGVYINDSKIGLGVVAQDAQLSGVVRIESSEVRTLGLRRSAIGGIYLQHLLAQAIVIRDCSIASDANLADLHPDTTDLRETEVGGNLDLKIGTSTASRATLRIDSLQVSGELRARVGGVIISAPRIAVNGGGNLELSDSTIRLPFSHFGAQMHLSGVPGVDGLAQVELLDLHGADVGNLALSVVDMGHCRLDGAFRLSELRFADTVTWGAPPRNLGLAMAVQRRTVSAEHHVRSRGGANRWHLSNIQPSDQERHLGPLDVADIYRQLRIGQEERGNEAGSGDFYYGEMEMRRKGTGSWGERLLLTLYWIASGYGQRAWRSLAALTVLIATAAFIVGEAGLQGREYEVMSGTERFRVALVISAESAAAIFRDGEADVNLLGRSIQVALRLLGPLLLGLGALSLRSRVRR